MIKKIRIVVFLFPLTNTFSIYTQEQGDLNQKDIITVASPIEQDQLKDWQEHMQRLLEKGISWDFGNNVPINDWKNTALEIAQKVIQNNSSLANEIKTSFVATINDKIALENGLHSTFTTDLIADFNRQVDEWIEKPAESTDDNKKIVAEIQQDIHIPEETIVTTVENTSTPELLSTTTPDTQENKDYSASEKEWTDYLKSLTEQDYDDKNIQDLINKAHKLAQETVMPAQSPEQKNRIDILKNEFKSAIELQSKTKGFGGVSPDTIIAEFNKKLDESITQQPIQTNEQLFSRSEQLPIPDSSQIAPSINMSHNITKPMGPMSQNMQTKTPYPSLKTESKAVKPHTDTTDSEYITIPHYTAPVDNQVLFEKEQEEIAKQKALKQAVVTQIKQKAAFDAEKKEKQTIIASLMEKIFHVDIDDWFKSNKKTPTIESIPEIIETILRAEQDMEKRTSKKNAYMQFQSTLLAFNNKTFWDSKNNRPLQSWVDKIKTELAILTNYKMITAKQAVDIIDQTLQISSKIAESDRLAVKNTIKDFLETITQTPTTEKH